MSYKNSALLLISLTFVFIILFYYELNHIEYNSKPTPTEFITKKKREKSLKNLEKNGWRICIDLILTIIGV